MAKHLLWASLFLKSYANETFLSTLTGVDEENTIILHLESFKGLARLRIVSSQFFR